MVIHEGCENLNLRLPAVTIGIFDGVHLGHRTLLKCLVSRALELGGESAVITFNPHPRLVLGREKKMQLFLSTVEEKAALLEREHIDHLIIMEFSDRFSKMPACDFIKEILVKKIGIRHLVVGYDHHFGFRGEGNFDTISRCARTMDFTVEQLQEYNGNKGIISSSLIRDAILNGNLDDAKKWLGYDYMLKGEVVDGRKIGRSIGFPTANIRPFDQHKLIPGDGVYAVEVFLGSLKLKGMLSIGNNPTLNIPEAERSIEVNIFNFEEKIYGREIEVIFRYRMRDNLKFGTTGELSLQMESDREKALSLLS